MSGSEPGEAAREGSEDEGVRLREAVAGDCVAIALLKARYGLAADPARLSGADCLAAYRHLFIDNPALADCRGPVTPGWVVQAGDQVVGYLGSIPLIYRRGPDRFVAAVACSFVVDTAYRSSSLLLASAFWRQKNVDLMMSTTANHAAGKVFSLMKCERIPSDDYDIAWFWITGATGFVTSALRKQGLSAPVAHAMALPIGPLVASADRLFGRRPGRNASALDIDVVSLSDMGDEFDELWERKCLENRYLLRSRDARSLNWHFARHAANNKSVEILRCRRGGRLVGYAILTSENVEPMGLKRRRLTDLIGENDAPDVLLALLKEAYALASDRGSHLLEVMGFPIAIRKVLATRRPHARQLPTWPLYYKVVSSDLAEDLRPEQWYVSAVDGDTSLYAS
jgi:hypothetical protein